jgi:Fe2+ transport system protein FeoA
MSLPLTPAAGHTLASTRRRRWATVVAVGGERAFRRRLREMGLVPGTPVRVVNDGDPLILETRWGRLSIRAREAAAVEVSR